VLYAVKGVF